MAHIGIAWLRGHGVAGDDATLADIAQHAEAALAVKVGEALAERLTTAQLEEYGRLITEGAAEPIRQQWLDRYCPDYDKLVSGIVTDFRREIAASEFPITYILEQMV